MKNPVFTGAAVAIITPMYEDGSVNFDELGRIIEDQIARGTSIRSTTASPSWQVQVPTIPITAVHWRQNLLPAARMPCCW